MRWSPLSEPKDVNAAALREKLFKVRPISPSRRSAETAAEGSIKQETEAKTSAAECRRPKAWSTWERGLFRRSPADQVFRRCAAKVSNLPTGTLASLTGLFCRTARCLAIASARAGSSRHISRSGCPRTTVRRFLKIGTPRGYGWRGRPFLLTRIFSSMTAIRKRLSLSGASTSAVTRRRPCAGYDFRLMGDGCQTGSVQRITSPLISKPGWGIHLGKPHRSLIAIKFSLKDFSPVRIQ